MPTAFEKTPLRGTPLIPGSLAAKILLPVLLVFIFTNIVLYSLYMERTKQQGLASLKNQLESFASSKAAELTDPLWNFQDTLLESLMRSYRDNRNLRSISLYGRNGDLLIEETMDVPDTTSTVLTTERTLTRKVGGEIFTVGKLVVAYHDSHLRTGLKTRRASDAGTTIVLICVVVGTIWLFLHFLVGRPLLQLKLSLQHNAVSKNRTPLVWNSRDEIGQVVTEYNALLKEVEGQTNKLLKNNAILERQIAQRKAAERQLAQAHKNLENTVALRTMELRQANEELVELDNQRTAFLSSASHELRTPLSAVLGFSKLIQKTFTKHFMPLAKDKALKDKGEVMISNLEIISKEGDRLTRLINDLLDLNKIESGHMEWRDTLLNLPNEIERAVGTMRPEFDKRDSVDLILDIPQVMPPLSCDPDRIQQLLINLLSNALKHTDSGEVRVTATTSKGMIRIAITDTGVGIPSGEQKFIFRKFYQSEANANSKPSGTGLGLPICKNIAEHYHGSITVASEVGVGSTFTVELPAEIR